MRTQFLALMLLFFMPFAWAAPTAQHPFALVMIDQASESRYGGFPIDRALVAQVVDKLAAAGVRAVVLKFFYDLPSNSASDAALAAAISKIRVLLQSRSSKNAMVFVRFKSVSLATWCVTLGCVDPHTKSRSG